MTPKDIQNKHKQLLSQQTRPLVRPFVYPVTKPSKNALRRKPRGSEKMIRSYSAVALEAEEEKDDGCYFMPTQSLSTRDCLVKRETTYATWSRKLYLLRNPLNTKPAGKQELLFPDSEVDITPRLGPSVPPIAHFALPFLPWRNPKEEAADEKDRFNVPWTSSLSKSPSKTPFRVGLDYTRFHKVLPDSQPLSRTFSLLQLKADILALQAPRTPPKSTRNPPSPTVFSLRQLKADILTLQEHPQPKVFRTFRPLFRPEIPIRDSSLPGGCPRN